MWYPKKAAFRAGYVISTQWDSTNIGNYSVAFGQNITASGTGASAFGNSANASGDYSFASGQTVTASGSHSAAMGNSVTASGDYSTALGSYVSTSGKGSFIIGDQSVYSVLSNTTANQMMMRFVGGYTLYTNTYANIGATLGANQNQWATTSDSTKKCAFLPVNGEYVLNKINDFYLRSWSYKGQDSTKYRHYGPMAQEFFAAFGHDNYGIIGNDTTINTADFEGINLIAIKALIRRTKELQEKTNNIENLKSELTLEENQINEQQKQIKELLKMKAEFTNFKSAVENYIKRNGYSQNKLTINN